MIQKLTTRFNYNDQIDDIFSKVNELIEGYNKLESKTVGREDISFKNSSMFISKTELREKLKGMYEVDLSIDEKAFKDIIKHFNL